MNIRKRFFSFLMAFAMLVSCMTVAHATEVEETAALTSATTNQEIAPRATQTIVQGDTFTNQNFYGGQFTLSNSKYLTMVVQNPGTSITIEVFNMANGSVYSRTFQAGTTGAHSFTNSKVPSGQYSYVITLGNYQAAYAFSFEATDYYHA
ncbi:MAG: hypothetical protein HFJ50_05925 [Clostridia bacterium]|jgi:hypothetical protein|nr:hypothetical protein [Clostridia bacterium]